MKRGRKASDKPAGPVAALPREMVDRARAKLQADFLDFLADTATEDPKRYLARLAAAREAAENLARLDELTGASGPAVPSEPSEAELLAAARAALAHENKS
jgi:hypothetical protein